MSMREVKVFQAQSARCTAQGATASARKLYAAGAASEKRSVAPIRSTSGSETSSVDRRSAEVQSEHRGQIVHVFRHLLGYMSAS